MVKSARLLSLRLPPGIDSREAGRFADALAGHLLGLKPRAGDEVALPGWPPATVQRIEPKGSQVVAGTGIDIVLPPPLTDGPLHVAFLVDASLTMGRGGELAPFREAARLIDGFLLSGRPFLASASIVVQGGSTRMSEAPRAPEDVTGASILRIVPKGTFDLTAGIEHSLDLLDDTPEGPRVIVVITDGQAPRDTRAVAQLANEASVAVAAVLFGKGGRMREICAMTGGVASNQPQRIFDLLAELAEAEGALELPEPPPEVSNGSDPAEFEVVIEAMEET